ncbi:MAG TPA: hypothetical protein VLH79_10875 [Chthonomonadales bacterium]|nr:hypothetical protein [Chthonomonadales bacterium]
MTAYDPDQHHRHSMRLKEYDYASAGAYFVTICTQDRACLLGHVDGSDMLLSDAGKMVAQLWDDLPSRFPHVVLDAFVVMPNHIHGIIVLTDPVDEHPVDAHPGSIPTRSVAGAQSPADTDCTPVGAPLVGALPTVVECGTTAPTRGAPTVAECVTTAPTRGAPTVGSVVGVYKSLTTFAFIRGVRTLGWPRFRGRLWQRNFYEHVIRDETSLNQIREYIANNPPRWAEDTENPGAETGRGR